MKKEDSRAVLRKHLFSMTMIRPSVELELLLQKGIYHCRGCRMLMQKCSHFRPFMEGERGSFTLKCRTRILPSRNYGATTDVLASLPSFCILLRGPSMKKCGRLCKFVFEKIRGEEKWQLSKPEQKVLSNHLSIGTKGTLSSTTSDPLRLSGDERWKQSAPWLDKLENVPFSSRFPQPRPGGRNF